MAAGGPTGAEPGSRHGPRSTGRTLCPDRPVGRRGERLPLPPHELRAARDRHPRLPEDHGRQGGTGGAVRHPPAADLVLREHGHLRSHLLPADGLAPLLLLVHRRVHRHGLSLAGSGGTGPVRSHDHGLQPRRHVRGRAHQAGPRDLPRRLLGDRRVHHPQGVRLVQDRGRDGQPHQPGPRRHPGVRGRGGARRHRPQRRGPSLSEARARSPTSRRSWATSSGAIPAPRSSGPTAASGASCAR